MHECFSKVDARITEHSRRRIMTFLARASCRNTEAVPSTFAHTQKRSRATAEFRREGFLLHGMRPEREMFAKPLEQRGRARQKHSFRQALEVQRQRAGTAVRIAVRYHRADLRY